MEISQKNNKFKKILIVAMAATMIPSVVAPITANAAPAANQSAKTATVALTTGYNMLIEVDGKLNNGLFNKRKLVLVSTLNNLSYNVNSKDYTWVAPNQIYDIYDVTNGTKTHKGKINVNSTTSNIATLKYSSVEETQIVKAADADLKADSYAYEGVYANDPYAELFIDNQRKIVSNNNVMAHAPSSIQFDLEGKNYTEFTGYVGLDARRPTGTIRVDVLIDGKEVGTPDYQKPNWNASFIKVYIPKDAKTLEIRAKGVYTGANPNENAMLVLADGEFKQKVKTIK